MYQHILVPVDFDHGNLGAQALEVAKSLLAEGGRVTLLHAMQDVPGFVATHLPEGTLEANRTRALDALTKMGQAISDRSEATVVKGQASHAILQFAQGHDVDCIIVASHKPGLEDYLLGSTAARVVRHAGCGVHVLR